jgi:hypothetical protein
MLHRGRRNLGKRSRRQKIDETRARNALGRLLIWIDPLSLSQERRSGQLAAPILLRLAGDRWSVRIFDLDPMRRSSIGAPASGTGISWDDRERDRVAH